MSSAPSLPEIGEVTEESSDGEIVGERRGEESVETALSDHFSA
jgi:hypothetical protein